MRTGIIVSLFLNETCLWKKTTINMGLRHCLQRVVPCLAEPERFINITYYNEQYEGYRILK